MHTFYTLKICCLKCFIVILNSHLILLSFSECQCYSWCFGQSRKVTQWPLPGWLPCRFNVQDRFSSRQLYLSSACSHLGWSHPEQWVEIWREELQNVLPRGNSMWLHELEYGHPVVLRCPENVTLPMSAVPFYVLFSLNLSVLGGKIALVTTKKLK